MNKILFLALLLTFFLRLPGLFEPDWYDDEGIYLTIGQSLSKGAVLYKDITDNKPPFLYLLSSVLQTQFNLRLALLFWSLATVTVFYFLASKHKLAVATFPFIVVSQTPLLEGNIANAEIFIFLPILLSLLLILHHKKYALAGFIAGLSLLIKLPALLEIFALAVLILIQTKNLKKLLSYLVFSSLPLLFLSLYYNAVGIFQIFISQVFSNNIAYLNSIYVGNHTTYLPNNILIFKFCLVLALCLVCLKSRLGYFYKFLLLWFLLAFFSSQLSGRSYYHYYLQLASPFSLLLAIILQKKYLILLSTVLLFLFSFAYYLNFFSGNSPLYFPKDTPSIYSAAKYIKANSNPNQKLFLWVNDPQLYYLSARSPSFMYLLKYHIIDSSTQSQAIDNIKVEMPLVVTYPGQDFKQLSSLLSQYYNLLYENQRFLVYSPK